jgi:hypothetical protein
MDGTLLPPPLPPLLPLVLLVGLLSSSAVVDKGLPDLLLPAEKLPVARLDMVPPVWFDCCARRTCMHRNKIQTSKQITLSASAAAGA